MATNIKGAGSKQLVPEPQPTGRNSESFKSTGAINKAEVARHIFNEVGVDLPRKEVLQRFQKEAGLTAAGASTYYQNFKKEAGLVGQVDQRTGRTAASSKR